MSDTPPQRQRGPGCGASDVNLARLSEQMMCQECGQQLNLNTNSLLVSCSNAHCAGWGKESQLHQWWASNRVDDDANPPGLPRPVAEGAPVPYLAPVYGEFTLWRGQDLERQTRCQRQWLCQVCGTALERQAWVIVMESGRIVSDSAMHAACVSMATAWCPALPEHLSRSGWQALKVERADIHVEEVLLSRSGRAPAVWWLRAHTENVPHQ